MKLICVKTKKKYTNEYVINLISSVLRNSTIHIEDFICVTDDPNSELKEHGLSFYSTDKNGWWGKVDVFNITGPCLYLDLDTVITDNIDSLLEGIENLSPQEVIMIKPWKKLGWASGIMGWNSDSLSFISSNFKRGIPSKYQWDQRYIAAQLITYLYKVIPAQRFVDLYSYKHHCKVDGPPSGAQIVCFHGNPRPHEVRGLDWVQEHWR